MAEAQRISKGVGVVVAVLDSGVSADHQDLEGAVLPGVNTIRAGGTGNADTEGHGTAMAGIIAARGRSGERGLLGIAPAATILPVRPADDPYFAADGIEWAAAHGAQVLNMSFAVPNSERMREAIRTAVEADVVLVSSVGNTGDKGNVVEFPGGYPEVLAVGAVGRDGKVAPFSQHGPQVDIVAPGVDMYTAGLSDTYRQGWGSSNSAAVLSGAAALIRAKYPELTAPQVIERLTATAVDRGDTGRDDYYGHGVVDLVAALTAAQPAPSVAGPIRTDAPVVAPAADTPTHDEGLPPPVIVGFGVVLLAVAVAVLAALRRSAGG